MKKVKLLPTEYYVFKDVAKLMNMSYSLFGVSGGFVIIEANIELLRQIGY